jgi:hypothetical protein
LKIVIVVVGGLLMVWIVALVTSGTTSPEQVSNEIESMCSARTPDDQQMIGQCRERNATARALYAAWLDQHAETNSGRAARERCQHHLPDRVAHWACISAIPRE